MMNISIEADRKRRTEVESRREPGEHFGLSAYTKGSRARRVAAFESWAIEAEGLGKTAIARRLRETAARLQDSLP